MKSRLILVLVAASTLALGGCATAPLSYRNYSATENLGTQTLQTGVVIRTMPIEIRDSAAPNANSCDTGTGARILHFPRFVQWIQAIPPANIERVGMTTNVTDHSG
jgi:hypothetical protein